MTALFAGSMIVNDGFGLKIHKDDKPTLTASNPVRAVDEPSGTQRDVEQRTTEMQNAFETANSVIEHYADNPVENPVAVYTAIVNFNSAYEAGRNRQGVDRTTFDREFSHFPADLIKKFRDSVAAKAKKEYEAEILKKAECDNIDQMMRDIRDFRLFNEGPADSYEVADEEQLHQGDCEL